MQERACSSHWAIKGLNYLLLLETCLVIKFADMFYVSPIMSFILLNMIYFDGWKSHMLVLESTFLNVVYTRLQHSINVFSFSWIYGKFIEVLYVMVNVLWCKNDFYLLLNWITLHRYSAIQKRHLFTLSFATMIWVTCLLEQK